jgi:putative transposase
MFVKKAIGRVSILTLDFKGSHYPRDVILYAVFFYVRYAVSYRDLEEIMGGAWRSS